MWFTQRVSVSLYGCFVAYTESKCDVICFFYVAYPEIPERASSQPWR